MLSKQSVLSDIFDSPDVHSTAISVPKSVRSIVGLDRDAASRAMSGFIAGKALKANQIEFLTLIVDHLAEHGMIEPARLYESPFIELSSSGPNGLFNPQHLNELFAGVETANAIQFAV